MTIVSNVTITFTHSQRIPVVFVQKHLLIVWVMFRPWKALYCKVLNVWYSVCHLSWQCEKSLLEKCMELNVITERLHNIYFHHLKVHILKIRSRITDSVYPTGVFILRMNTSSNLWRRPFTRSLLTSVTPLAIWLTWHWPMRYR